MAQQPQGDDAMANDPNILNHNLGNLRSERTHRLLHQHTTTAKIVCFVGLYQMCLGFTDGIPVDIICSRTNPALSTAQEKRDWKRQVMVQIQGHDRTFTYNTRTKKVRLKRRGLGIFQETGPRMYLDWVNLFPHAARSVEDAIANPDTTFSRNVTAFVTPPTNNDEMCNKICFYFAKSGRCQQIIRYLFANPGWQSFSNISNLDAPVHAGRPINAIAPRSLRTALTNCSPIVEERRTAAPDPVSHYRIGQNHWVDLPDNGIFNNLDNDNRVVLDPRLEDLPPPVVAPGNPPRED